MGVDERKPDFFCSQILRCAAPDIYERNNVHVYSVFYMCCTVTDHPLFLCMNSLST